MSQPENLTNPQQQKCTGQQSAQPQLQEFRQSPQVNTPCQNIQSKTCRAIIEVLGMREDIIELDKYEAVYKSKKTYFGKQKRQQLKQKIQTDVSKVVNDSILAAQKWEEFFLTNHRIPNEIDRENNDDALEY